MLRDDTVRIEDDGAPDWTRPTQVNEPAWCRVDRALRTIAKRRGALDAEEARWLREAEALRIWRPLGMVNALDYMERVLGYGPRAAFDRLRVARALGQLPALAAALEQGALPFSAVRELTRVAVPATEARWLEAARGRNLRQIEDLVAGHRPGDDPDDPPDPSARSHVVRFEVSPETFALLRQAKLALDEEHGRCLDDDALIAALAHGALEGRATDQPDGRARYQIATIVCERCRQGWQQGAGVSVPIDDAAVMRAECDAQHVGSLDGTPARAYQDVPPRVGRQVHLRDGGRCRVPGCRSSRGLELHHIVHREQGGTHDESNIVLLCSSCHAAHHRGALTISGTASDLAVQRHGPTSDLPTSAHAGASASAPRTSDAHVGAAASTEDPRVASALASASDDPIASAPLDEYPLDAAIMRAHARDALVSLGWKSSLARDAVETAIARLGPQATLEQVIADVLRWCPKPGVGTS
jgi:hypothetical protein